MNEIKKKKSRNVFTLYEDILLMKSIEKHSDLDWKQISSEFSNRTPRQCRERWVYYLSQERSKENWSTEEDELLIKLVNQNGKKWSELKIFFPKRTYSDIKNRWYAFISKRNEPKFSKDNLVEKFFFHVDEKMNQYFKTINSGEFYWEI